MTAPTTNAIGKNAASPGVRCAGRSVWPGGRRRRRGLVLAVVWGLVIASGAGGEEFEVLPGFDANSPEARANSAIEATRASRQPRWIDTRGSSEVIHSPWTCGRYYATTAGMGRIDVGDAGPTWEIEVSCQLMGFDGKPLTEIKTKKFPRMPPGSATAYNIEFQQPSHTVGQCPCTLKTTKVLALYEIEAQRRVDIANAFAAKDFGEGLRLGAETSGENSTYLTIDMRDMKARAEIAAADFDAGIDKFVAEVGPELRQAGFVILVFKGTPTGEHNFIAWGDRSAVFERTTVERMAYIKESFAMSPAERRAERLKAEAGSQNAPPPK